MNVVDELKNLDVNDVGRWPLLFRAAVIFVVFLAVTGAGIWFTIIKDKLREQAAQGSQLRCLQSPACADRTIIWHDVAPASG